MSLLNQLNKRITLLACPERAKSSLRYFKTGKGEYGEGDVFIGITAPELRALSKEYIQLPLADCITLLTSPIHELRMLALFILALQFKKANEQEQFKIYSVYLEHTQYINNWDLVDCSAPHISGPYLVNRDKNILYTLAKSDLLWDRRIAMISCFSLIRDHQFEDALNLSEIFLSDKEDLMHKAVGWMLRELGKRNKEAEVAFLNKYAALMPRVMLRYAIEKFDHEERQYFLSLK
jgi:3-methyladenine DNA glycosylase AlkD